MSVSVERKAEIISEYKTKEGDTGSPEVQIALLTEKISQLSSHMEQHANDLHSRRGLLTMVGRRRKLLDYLKKIDEKRYLTVIERLNIRR
jgi:small subunit ribosomal protein S15